ncbi:MAG: flavodoxin family protein [Deltaproteobacteria bacterium]|jgi:multimeric flavodoxin WrbA|nr:flavodoxin family protein [Deltaproteobacteria bacterium]
MKVLLLNGSPHEKGCTYTALAEIASELTLEGVDSRIFWVGRQPVSGCQGCGGCQKKGRCVLDSGPVNEFVGLAAEADGFIFGSPVHYASACGTVSSFLDRVFYSARAAGGQIFYLKPGAAVVSARRAGTTAALDQRNKYFTISQMPVVSSGYWNNVHGFTPEDVRKDEEGLYVMRVLARNMAWLLKSLEAGRQSGLARPRTEEPKVTHFIR